MSRSSTWGDSCDADLDPRSVTCSDCPRMKLWQLSASAISSMIERGDASSQQVVTAHIERINWMESRVHAFTEVLRDGALVEAQRSDARRRRGESRGPLDGVPVTIKECFDVVGRATTLGLPSWR